MKHPFYSIGLLVLIVIAAELGVLGAFLLRERTALHTNSLGGFYTTGYLTPTVTNTNISCGGSISGATTSVWAAGTNYQRAVLSNLGGGNVYLGFGVNASTTKGMRLNSSTFSQQDITDPNLLAKVATCVADATSTVSVMVY